MVKLTFQGTENSIDNTCLEVFANSRGELYISITDSKYPLEGGFITLDKETAIKLSKEIRKQISLID